MRTNLYLHRLVHTAILVIPAVGVLIVHITHNVHFAGGHLQQCIGGHVSEARAIVCAGSPQVSPLLGGQDDGDMYVCPFVCIAHIYQHTYTNNHMLTQRNQRTTTNKQESKQALIQYNDFYVSVYIHTHTHTCMHSKTFKHVYIYAHMHIYAYIRTHARTHAYLDLHPRSAVLHGQLTEEHRGGLQVDSFVLNAHQNDPEGTVPVDGQLQLQRPDQVTHHLPALTAVGSDRLDGGPVVMPGVEVVPGHLVHADGAGGLHLGIDARGEDAGEIEFVDIEHGSVAIVEHQGMTQAIGLFVVDTIVLEHVKELLV